MIRLLGRTNMHHTCRAAASKKNKDGLTRATAYACQIREGASMIHHLSLLLAVMDDDEVAYFRDIVHRIKILMRYYLQHIDILL